MNVDEAVRVDPQGYSVESAEANRRRDEWKPRPKEDQGESREPRGTPRISGRGREERSEKDQTGTMSSAAKAAWDSMGSEKTLAPPGISKDETRGNPEPREG